MDWQQQQRQYYEEQQRRQQEEWNRSQEEHRRQQQENWQRQQEEQRKYQEELHKRQWQQLHEYQQQQENWQRQQDQQRYWGEQQQRQRDQQEQEEQRQSNRVQNQPIQSSSNYHSPSNYVSNSSLRENTPYRASSYFRYWLNFIRIKRILILGVVAGGFYAINPAPVDGAIDSLYSSHQETIDPILKPVQRWQQQIYAGFTRQFSPNAKPQSSNSSTSQPSAEELARKQALNLNAAISQAGVDPTTFYASVDKLFYARHPELAGRSLTIHPNDANLRREWEELAWSQLQQF